MTKLHAKLASLEWATLGVAMMLAVVASCATQPRADSPEVAATAAVPTKPQAAVEVPEDAATPAEQESTLAADPPQTVDESSAQQGPPESVASDSNNGREYRTVFYRADAKQPAAIPSVQLSKGHETLCRVKVGDNMPAIDLKQLGAGRVSLSDLAGKTATVLVFWKSDRSMSHQLLVDMGPDVIEPFGGAGVAVVGVAVGETAENAQAALSSAGAKFPNLLDTDGRAFAQVGSEKLPRTYLLDPQGKILWFDIEYSLATRRELHQALQAVTAERSE